MTKTYELPNEKMIMADIDEKHHTATVSVYALDNLVESVNRTGHWTPCSERLPKAGEYDGDVAKYYLVQNEYGDMLVARWDGKGWEQMYQYEYLEDNVIAWRPLPEPMKAESEE